MNKLPPADPTYLFDHAEAPLCALDQGALSGLRHRTVIDHLGGAAALALWLEEHEPGFVVPLHLHDCEEIISVIEGGIEASIGEKKIQVAAGQSILIPAREPHGFRVTRGAPFKMFAIFSSANPKIFRTDGTESTPPWRGGTSDHLE